MTKFFKTLQEKGVEGVLTQYKTVEQRIAELEAENKRLKGELSRRKTYTPCPGCRERDENIEKLTRERDVAMRALELSSEYSCSRWHKLGTNECSGHCPIEDSESQNRCDGKNLRQHFINQAREELAKEAQDE